MRVDETTAGLAFGTESVQAPKAAKDEFLSLLVAQLEHQNPLDPQNGAEFVAQLAQFAAVEQGSTTNDLLTAIQTQQMATSNMGVAQFVGKSVTATTDTITIAEDVPPQVSLTLDGDAEQVEIIVRDETGAAVRTIQLGAQPKGDVSVAWDGTDARGLRVPEGSYRLEVKATTKAGVVVPATTRITGTITAVEFSGGAPLLRLGATTVAPRDVLTIGM